MTAYDRERRTWYGRSLGSLVAEVVFILVVVAILTRWLSPGRAVLAAAVVGLVLGLVKYFRLPPAEASDTP